MIFILIRYRYLRINARVGSVKCAGTIVLEYVNSKLLKSVPCWYSTLPGNGNSIHFFQMFWGLVTY
jgi:hypothetical protein